MMFLKTILKNYYITGTSKHHKAKSLVWLSLSSTQEAADFRLVDQLAFLFLPGN